MVTALLPSQPVLPQTPRPSSGLVFLPGCPSLLPLLSLGEQLGLRHNPRPGDSHHEFDFANHVQPFLFVYTEESVPWKVSKS